MDKFGDANQEDANENQLKYGNNERVGSSINSVSHDDDDDWSRQVETDETLVHIGHDDSLRMMESVMEEHDGGPPQPPSQRPLTLKEKLVMRERERRIETERARLKRQFALNNVEQDVDTEITDNDLIRVNADMLHQSTMESSRENGSVTDTLGEESIVAHPDEENSDESRLGFNMERFLRNSNSFDPEIKPADSKETPDQGVLMERFLNEPLMPEATNAAINGEVNRSVSLDVDGMPTEAATRQSSATLLMPPSFDDYTNASEKPTLSTMAEAHQDNTVSRENSVDDHDLISDVASSTNSHTHHEPRLLRLTEADMEELAAIDEASIGNAPPSEREETLSEIGELADFGGSQNARFGAENLSADTPTTAQDESVTTSLLSGIQNINSELDRHSDQRSFEGSGAIKNPSPLAQLTPCSSDTRKANPYSSISPRGDEAMDNELNSSYHFDADFPARFELKDNEEQKGVDELRLDIRSVKMEGPHELDEIRIVAPGSPIHIDADLTTGNWSPKGGMNVSPLQVRRQVSLPRDSLLNYGSLEAGEMLPKKAEKYLSHQEALPLLSKVPPEVVMSGSIPWRHASEVRLSTVAVLATGIAVGLVVGIVVGATIVPLIAK